MNLGQRNVPRPQNSKPLRIETEPVTVGGLPFARSHRYPHNLQEVSPRQALVQRKKARMLRFSSSGRRVSHHRRKLHVQVRRKPVRRLQLAVRCRHNGIRDMVSYLQLLHEYFTSHRTQRVRSHFLSGNQQTWWEMKSKRPDAPACVPQELLLAQQLVRIAMMIHSTRPVVGHNHVNRPRELNTETRVHTIDKTARAVPGRTWLSFNTSYWRTWYTLRIALPSRYGGSSK